MNQVQWFSTSPVPATPSYLFCSTPSLLSPLPPTSSSAAPMQVPFPGEGCSTFSQASEGNACSSLLPSYMGYGVERPSSRNELFAPVGRSHQQFCPEEPSSFDDFPDAPPTAAAPMSAGSPSETPPKNSRWLSGERLSPSLPRDIELSKTVCEVQGSSLTLTPLKTSAPCARKTEQECGRGPGHTQRPLLLSDCV